MAIEDLPRAAVLGAADRHLLSRAKRRTSWAAVAACKCACMTLMTHAINPNAEGPLQTGKICEPCATLFPCEQAPYSPGSNPFGVRPRSRTPAGRQAINQRLQQQSLSFSQSRTRTRGRTDDGGASSPRGAARLSALPVHVGSPSGFSDLSSFNEVRCADLIIRGC